MHLRAREPGLLKDPRPGARSPYQARLPPPCTHLAPVGCSVQRLPAVLVSGAQAGPVLQQQGSRLTKPVGGRNV